MEQWNMTSSRLIKAHQNILETFSRNAFQWHFLKTFSKNLFKVMELYFKKYPLEIFLEVFVNSKS